MRKSTNIGYKTDWIDLCCDGIFKERRIKGKTKRYLGKWSRSKILKEVDREDFDIDMNFVIKANDIYKMNTQDFEDILEFCKKRKSNKFFNELYIFLDQFSYDFAAEYIGEDV